MNLFEYVQSIEHDMLTWEKKPHVLNYPQHQNSESLRGKTFGTLKVSGYSPYLKRWIVRCSCGFYEPRTSKAIKNTANSEDSCVYCKRTEHIIKTVPNLKGTFDFKSLVLIYKKKKRKRIIKEHIKNKKPPIVNTSTKSTIIEKPNTKTNKLFVTKHACERYIERVENVSMNEARLRIYAIIQNERRGGISSFSVVSCCCLFIVRDNRVVTIINHN